MIKLLKTTIEGLTLYDEKKFSIDFVTDKRVYQYEKSEGIVSNWHKNLNTLNNISFIGINASGKTTTLNILADVLELFIANKSLQKDMRLSRYFTKECQLTNYFLVEYATTVKIYKLISTIQKDQNNQQMIFKEEYLYEKELKKVKNQQEVYEFDCIDASMVRSEIGNEFLKTENSIFSAILNRIGEELPMVQDLMYQTNFNYLSAYNNSMPLSFVQYFDSSIEFFRLKSDDNDPIQKFELKFKKNPQILLIDFRELELYLSSGTIKGISLLNRALFVLKTGGYFIIDEIENHLNKIIVIHLIKLFTSELNKKGAVLIFSTHYSEILDTIDRSDSIYVVHRNPEISVGKFSLLAQKKDRIDKKKSDLILSGSVHSAPSYQAYSQLTRDIKVILGEQL